MIDVTTPSAELRSVNDEGSDQKLLNALVQKEVHFVLLLSFGWIQLFQNVCNHRNKISASDFGFLRFELLKKLSNCHWFA